MELESLKDFLDAKVNYYQKPEFLESDPIQVPHSFNNKQDVEISAFLTATIAWGNRKSIINNAFVMMEHMDNSPYEFVLNASEGDLSPLDQFVHRTFNGTDLRYFVFALRRAYTLHGGLESLFTPLNQELFLNQTIESAREKFFELPHLSRTEKHFSNPGNGSAAKRLHMFLRWMVRPAQTGIDFGIWQKIKPKQLSCPLDVHSGAVARKLGLLKRKQNDAKALMELDTNLRLMDPLDPVKYDFALFGLGVFEKFASN
ncbi:MAG: hypothetical protein RLZZ241_335 [Bacteroidota bacterium]|jgi:uncharacterized protein (TIGR02757 family)